MAQDTALSDMGQPAVEQDWSAFPLADCLYFHVSRALRREAPVAITHADLGTLNVWPHERAFDCDAELFERFCAQHVNAYRVHKLAGSGVAPQETGRIEDLLWTIGFAASGGRLVEGVSATDVIQLTQWPNLTRVPLGDRGLRLAVLYRRHAKSIPVAARLTGAERAEVQQFLSAAWCAGLVRVVNRSGATDETAAAADPDQARGSLVAALLRHLWR